jgi:hypothetical protein
MHVRADTTRAGYRSWFSLLTLVLLAIGLTYFAILPLFRPRGGFLWGHYRLKDIYLSIPLATAVLCALIIMAIPARRRRAASLRLVTAASAVLLVLAIFDAGYAFVVMRISRPNLWLDWGPISRKYSEADSELGFVRKPRIFWRRYVPEVDRVVDYRTDENGFRNPPRVARADIVFIGDSYTEGATIAEEDTFVRRLGQLTGLSVVNLGRGAYGAPQEQIVLKRFGLSYAPRVVVWQLFEGNDLADAETFAQWKQNPQLRPMSLKDRYFNNTLLNQWLLQTRPPEREGAMVTMRYPDGTAIKLTLRHGYDPTEASNRRVGMAETIAAIEAGSRLCQSQGISLVVLYIPTMAHVMAQYISFDRAEDQTSYLPQGVIAASEFGRSIGELCARAGCTFIDSFAALRQASQSGKQRLFIPNDEHLDPAGHEVVAQLIATWLRDKKVASVYAAD